MAQQIHKGCPVRPKALVSFCIIFSNGRFNVNEIVLYLLYMLMTQLFTHVWIRLLNEPPNKT